jgi:type II secretory pathway component PulF
MEANSPDEVVFKLTQQGFFPLKVEPSQSEISLPRQDGENISVRIPARDLNLFTRQLASLVKSGVPLLKGLHIIIEQTESRVLTNMVEDIAGKVKQGRMLSDALACYPRAFPSLYIALIRAGEASGTLEQALIRLAEHRQRLEQIKSHIRAALAYPIFMVSVAVITIIVLMTLVIPQLKKVFEMMKEELPLSTRILIGVSDAVRDYWYLFAVGIVLFIIILKSVTFIEKYAWDRAKLHFPVLGRFWLKLELARFARTLGLLLTNGISIVASLEITIPTLSNEAIKRELKKVAEGLKGGNPLSTGLTRSEKVKFPPFMVNLIAVGEESGRLDETMMEITNTYERETEELIKIALALLEPLLIVVLGAIVGFIVISMLLPIFTMGTMVS